MKKIVFILLFFSSVAESFSQSVLYFNFMTHNEETLQWDNPTFYANNRLKLISLATYFQTNGITWNMQSDWKYLSNVISQDPALITATTNSKNILLWMFEDMGVEMDPHGHETVYIYPDLVHLMDSIGLPESKLIGGGIYNDFNGINIWTNLVNGQNGSVFPSKFWEPDYLMGGGTPMHVADLNYFGFWNPQSTTSYLTHDTTSGLRHIGIGCDIKIKDTSDIVYILNDLREVIQNVQDGSYPANGFYVQNVFFEQADLNSMLFYNNVIEIADSMNAWVLAGDAQWKTLKQSYTLWETVYGAQMFQWNCDEFVGIEENVNKSIKNVYPNPTSDKLKIEFNAATFQSGSEIEIYNLVGERVYKEVILKSVSEIDVHDFSNGVYFYYVRNNQSILSKGKFIKQ